MDEKDAELKAKLKQLDDDDRRVAVDLWMEHKEEKGGDFADMLEFFRSLKGR